MGNGFEGDNIGKEASWETIEINQVKKKMTVEMDKAEEFQNNDLWSALCNPSTPHSNIKALRYNVIFGSGVFGR